MMITKELEFGNVLFTTESKDLYIVDKDNINNSIIPTEWYFV